MLQPFKIRVYSILQITK